MVRTPYIEVCFRPCEAGREAQQARERRNTGMRRRLGLGVVGVCLFAALVVPVRASDSRRDIVYDCTLFAIGDCDMAGPTVGYVLHSQRRSGTLQIQAFVRNGDPNTVYEVSVSCFPTHNNPLPPIAFDFLVTDATGGGPTPSSS